MTETSIRYLRAMKDKEGENGEFRLCEVADLLGLSKPGVSKAATRLSEEGLIYRMDNGRYKITDKGMTLLRFYEVCIYKISELLKERFPLKDSILKHEAVVIAGSLSDETLKVIYES